VRQGKQPIQVIQVIDIMKTPCRVIFVLS